MAESAKGAMPTALSLPKSIAGVAELEEMLSQPDEGVVDTLRRLKGDILVLGVAGKMGPTRMRRERPHHGTIAGAAPKGFMP